MQEYRRVLWIIGLVSIVFFFRFKKQRSKEPKRYVVIGASAAGIAAAQELRKLDAYARITVVNQEYELPYDKTKLDSYLVGKKSKEKITIFSREQAHEQAIELMLGKKVINIDRQKKIVQCADKTELFYDALFLGTGSKPRFLEIQGATPENMFTFNSLTDANAIKQYMATHAIRNIAIIGTGLTGLECAQALQELNAPITMVTRSEHVLASYLSTDAAAYIEATLQQRGLVLLKNREISDITIDDVRAYQLVLDNGSVIVTDLIIMALGVMPNSELAQAAGIAVNDQKAIVVDETMRTSDQYIWAGGDVIAAYEILRQEYVTSFKWSAAEQQALVAASAMTGGRKTYPGFAGITRAHIVERYVICGGNALHEYDMRKNKRFVYRNSNHYIEFVVHKCRLLSINMVLPTKNEQLQQALKQVLHEPRAITLENFIRAAAHTAGV